MTRSCLIIGILLLSTLLSACLPIPMARTAAPFKKRLDFIQKGTTTRAEVLAQLSGPYAERMNERFFAYLGYERDLGFCMVSTIPAGGPQCAAIGTAHFVGISFGEDSKVQRVDMAQANISGTELGITPWQACLVSGICFDYPSMMILAPPGEDHSAKRFIPDEKSCTIYIIGAGLKETTRFNLFLDNHDSGVIAEGTYLRWTPYLGSHRIDGKLTTTSNDKTSINSLSVTCELGQMLFIKPDLDGTLKFLSETQGKAFINISKRLLDAF